MCVCACTHTYFSLSKAKKLHTIYIMHASLYYVLSYLTLILYIKSYLFIEIFLMLLHLRALNYFAMPVI